MVNIKKLLIEDYCTIVQRFKLYEYTNESLLNLILTFIFYFFLQEKTNTFY